jgi:hypothetical protein
MLLLSLLDAADSFIPTQYLKRFNDLSCTFRGAHEKKLYFLRPKLIGLIFVYIHMYLHTKMPLHI